MLSKNTKQDILKAVQDGLLEISHRSEKFSSISKQAIEGLREYYNIPLDYKIFYTSSSTEAMQLALANCCESDSLHFVNGSFSGLSAKVAKSLNKNVTEDTVDYGQLNNFKKEIEGAYDFVALAQNETSSGVMCSLEDIKTLRKKFHNSIIAIDITSSAGALDFEIRNADIWYFSVQKCFGLPAGLGILIVSPSAYEIALKLTKEKNNLAGHFSLENMWKKMEDKYQTLQTPNVLNIYLLAKKLERWLKSGGNEYIMNQTRDKYALISNGISNSSNLDFFVKNEKERSLTSVCVSADEDYINKIHNSCANNHIVLGKGYGPLKTSTIRIANFPTVSKNDIKKLFELIS